MAGRTIDKLVTKIFSDTGFKNLEDYEYRDKITDLVIKGLYSLETSLFSQMESEAKGMGEVKEAISRLGKSLLDPAQIDKLDPGDKMALYNRLNTNMIKKLGLLQNFHQSIPQALKNIESMDELNSERRKRQREQAEKNKKVPREKEIRKEKEIPREKERRKEKVTAAESQKPMQYVNKCLTGPNNALLGWVTKVIDNVAVLTRSEGDFSIPLEDLYPTPDEKGFTCNFPEEAILSHLQGSAARKPDPEDTGNGNQGRCIRKFPRGYAELREIINGEDCDPGRQSLKPFVFIPQNLIASQAAERSMSPIKIIVLLPFPQFLL